MKDNFLAQRPPFSRSCHSKLLRHFSNLPVNGNSRPQRHASAGITQREQVIPKLVFSRATCAQHLEQLDPDYQAKFPSRHWWGKNPWSFAQVTDGNSSSIQALWCNHRFIISMSPFIITGLGLGVWKRDRQETNLKKLNSVNWERERDGNPLKLTSIIIGS